MIPFTAKKFLSLTPIRQHQVCAQLLRTFYEEKAENRSLYDTYCRWMGIDPYPISTMQQIADAYHTHLQAAQITLKEHRLLPYIRQTDRASASPSLNQSIFLDNLRSAHNVGSILRTVEAFQLGSVYFSPKTPWIDSKKVQDASMGAYQWVDCQQAPLSSLPKPVIALETSLHAVPLKSFTFPKNATYVVGNEEYGCSEETLDSADHLIEIPLRGKKNSLNVANAFAILASALAGELA